VAIIDKNKIKKPYANDRDEDVFIGLEIPLQRGSIGDGMFSSTQTTLEAVKNNLMNLLNTEMSERVMQPNLGVKLKRFLFEQYSDDLVMEIKTSVIDSLGYWMPFVQVNDIDVKMSDNQSGDFRNTLEVSIDFSLKKDPTSIESIQVTVGD